MTLQGATARCSLVFTYEPYWLSDVHLEAGVHLIVVQSADGSLVVGDTHSYADMREPFADLASDRLVLEEFEAVFPGIRYDCTERWIGTYASPEDRLALIDAPCDGVRLVVITSGTGASTAFAISEEVLAQMYGEQ